MSSGCMSSKGWHKTIPGTIKCQNKRLGGRNSHCPIKSNRQGTESTLITPFVFSYDTRCRRSTFQRIYLLWMIACSHCSSQSCFLLFSCTWGSKVESSAKDSSFEVVWSGDLGSFGAIRSRCKNTCIPCNKNSLTPFFSHITIHNPTSQVFSWMCVFNFRFGDVTSVGVSSQFCFSLQKLFCIGWWKSMLLKQILIGQFSVGLG